MGAQKKNKRGSICTLYANQEISKYLTKFEPALITIATLVGSPKEGPIRKANRERYMGAHLIEDEEEDLVVPTKGAWRRLRL